MDRKLKDFIRKVSNRNKVEKRQNAEATPASTRKERNSLPPRPKRPLSSQILEPTLPQADQNLGTSSSPLKLNSEPLKPSLEQKRKSLEQSYEHPPESEPIAQSYEHPPEPESLKAEEREPAHTKIHPESPPQGMSNLLNAVVKARKGSRAKNEDTKDSIRRVHGSINNDHSHGPAESVAHDYAAYQPILHPSSAPDASHTMHNEDVADRNIHTGDLEKTNSQNAARQSLDSTGTNSIRGGSLRHSLTSSTQPISSVETSPSAKSHYSTHNTGLNRVAQDETYHGTQKAKHDNYNSGREVSRGSTGKLLDLRAALMDGANDDRKPGQPDERMASDIKERLHAKGVNVDNSVDVDKTTTVAPAVTYEVVKPTTHHITKEEIYREIHNHEVYHRVLPVYETEVLPARHFVPDPKGQGLIEVSEDHLPDCTGVNQRWFIAEKETIPSSRKPLPQVTKPKFAGEKTYMTPEGFQRKETMIRHPPELEDMSNYKGPVQEVHFHHEALPDGVVGTNNAHSLNNSQGANKAHASFTAQASKATDALVAGHNSNGQPTYEDEVHDRAPDVKRLSMNALSKDLPKLPDHMVPPRSSSVKH